MTDEEFRQRKLALDRQLEAGIGLLRDSHRAQTQALELLWTVSRNAPAEPVSPPQQEPPPPARPKRRAPGELLDDVVIALDRVPDTFDKNDVCQALGYTPDRVSLFKVLQKLEWEGHIGVQEYGGGRRMTLYRRKESSDLTQDSP
jgi:hypothetical protein